MQFQFESLAAFWQMAGHGPYVWACYAIVLVCLVWVFYAPIRRRKQLFAQIERQQRIAAYENNCDQNGQSSPE